MKRETTKMLASGILGAILSGSVALAAVYTAEPASFKVLVNGQEFTSDPPAMVINGSTYLPLRAMGGALGVPVEWNSELNQAEVGNSAPKADANQYSRNNPAPINTVQEYTHKYPYSDIFDFSATDPDYTANIRVLETFRGDEALNMINSDSYSDYKPKEGYEFIIAKVAFSALSVQNDSSIDVSYSDFDFYSGNNEEYDSVYISMNEELSRNIYAGGTAEGYIVGMVKTDDKSPKLVYGLSLGKETYGKAVWFALQ